MKKKCKADRYPHKKMFKHAIFPKIFEISGYDGIKSINKKLETLYYLSSQFRCSSTLLIQKKII